MSVSKIKATVFSQEQLASDVFSMWLEVGNMAYKGFFSIRA